MAQLIGSDIDTLSTDARIHLEFFSNTELSREFSLVPLPRRFYVIALGAPDKIETLRHAIEKRLSDPHYSCEKFQSYVKSLHKDSAGGTEKDNPAFSAPEKVSLSVKARRMLAELWQREEFQVLSASAIVTLALVRMNDGSEAIKTYSGKSIVTSAPRLLDKPEVKAPAGHQHIL